MSRFTTRVELHEATEEDYEKLHAAMEVEGFTRTILNKAGTEYFLPPAEYNRSGDVTKDEILEAAKRAAATTGKRFSVLVTQGARKWWNLEKVE